MDEIAKHFHENDIPWIQGIPIDLYMEDNLFWPFTPNGHYNVKSGYRVSRELNLHPTRCSNMAEIQKWWKMIWSLQLPPRMKLFSWRVCHNWLPAKTNLKHRGMDINTCCDMCVRYEETLTHALWSFERVRNVWKLCSWYKNCSSLGEGSMFDVLMAIKQTNTKYEFEDTIKVMWAIWENRNRKWQQLPSMNDQQLIYWVFSAYPNVLKAGSDGIQQEADITINMKQWNPPATECICVNCDAAVVDKVAGMGLGYIWRKTDGQILAAGQIYRNGICLAKMAEAWAILEALKNPPAEATNTIEVQSDCRVLVEEINNMDQHHSAESNLLHQIHNVLANFQTVKIIHVKRTNNECANMLARKCLVDKNTQFFTHSFPDWLANFCKADYPNMV
ncbi:hypothetical protein G4B88_001280 [Cannabis sativa]|uniref:RNase H type-1 domain-containing protein n=1 Tax=Cannabis sativa TaxID=3483 RepID=A0A7J6I0H3_CANSA|nr:hypothetical protein G4B88_001280 [Cannabis sativa]